METEERQVLGLSTFRRDDAKLLQMQLAIRKEVITNRFSGETQAHSGEISWADESGPAKWSTQDRRTDCGEDHTAYIYVDDPSDNIARNPQLLYMDFTFLIRLRPNSSTCQAS